MLRSDAKKRSIVVANTYELSAKIEEDNKEESLVKSKKRGRRPQKSKNDKYSLDKHKELVNSDYYYYLYYAIQDNNYNFGDNKLDLEKAPVNVRDKYEAWLALASKSRRSPLQIYRKDMSQENWWVKRRTNKDFRVRGNRDMLKYQGLSYEDLETLNHDELKIQCKDYKTYGWLTW